MKNDNNYTVAVTYDSIKQEFITTCRCIARCAGWRETDTTIYAYNTPNKIYNILFKGSKKEAEDFRIRLDGVYKASNISQQKMTTYI